MAKSYLKTVEQSAGMLKYNRFFNPTISDNGTGSDNIDFSKYTFESGNYISHINIINNGSKPVWIVFDADGETITATDNTTYNGYLEADEGIELDGIASSIGFRCGSGLSTTVKVWVW
jgi:hypothetical protein